MLRPHHGPKPAWYYEHVNRLRLRAQAIDPWQADFAKRRHRTIRLMRRVMDRRRAMRNVPDRPGDGRNR